MSEHTDHSDTDDHDRILRLDGGLSTALEARGHAVTGALWTGELLRTNPEAIEQAHRDFVQAGADIVITATYQISNSGCAAAGWNDDDVSDAIRAAMTAARLAAVEGTLVAASVGPFGASLADGSEYRGNYGVSDAVLREFHRPRLEAILATEPDVLAIETIPDVTEARVILDVLTELDTGVPFWVAYSCTDGNTTCAGQPFAEAVAIVEAHPDAIAVGVNCTRPELITDLLRSADTELPFVVYPNTGRVWDAQSKTWSADGSVASADMVAEWARAGAAIIGGCCGYTADDIAALRLPS